VSTTQGMDLDERSVAPRKPPRSTSHLLPDRADHWTDASRGGFWVAELGSSFLPVEMVAKQYLGRYSPVWVWCECGQFQR